MRAVSGFLADDGTYFDTYEDAELHDSIHALTFAAETNKINPTNLITAVDKCATEVRRYLDAKAECNAKDSQGKSEAATINPVLWNQLAEYSNGTGFERSNNPATSGVYNSDDTGTDVDPSVLEQPPNRNEPVPDVGRRLFTEAIHDFGPVDGVGSRRSDAPSVRSDPDMAVNTQAEITKTW